MAYTYQTEDTQCGLFFSQARHFENDVFMRAKMKKGEPCPQWTDITWGQAAREAGLLGAGLIESGISKTEDGFFKTGDIGEFDADGMLRITDRKKSIIVTSGGKNIAPQPVEMVLIMDPFVDQACVIGDGRNYITALIVPLFDLVAETAREKGIPVGGNDDLVQHPEIVKFFQERVDGVNQNLARFEQIKKFRLLPRAFSEETGELTPTQKMKRRAIYEKYGREIDAMYQ